MVLRFTDDQWRQLTAHLLPNPLRREEAAFAFGRVAGLGADEVKLECIELALLSGPDLSIQQAHHIEVSEEAQARVIKRAHDLSASLVELHSHVDDPGPAFSWSDWQGFSEFVPHVWFRLKGKPYAAIVMSRSGLDALAWIETPTKPIQVQCIEAGHDRIEPSGLSSRRDNRGTE